MNEEAESFEQRLKRQPVRPVPAGWRQEILKAVAETQASRQPSTATEHSFLSNLHRRLVSVLWPHPVAWGGLASVWIFIFIVNYSIRDTRAAMAEKVWPPSPEVIGESRQEQRLLAQLISFQPTGSDDSGELDRQKASVPRPRSERTEFAKKMIL